MTAAQRSLQAFLHSGAAVLFLLALMFYVSSSWWLLCGVLGVACEVAAWIVWLHAHRKLD